MLRVLLTLVLATTMCNPARGQSDNPQLPNQPAIGIEDEFGTRSIQYWSAADVHSHKMRVRSTPDNPAFAGAEVWQMEIEVQSATEATMEAFSIAGMKDIKVLALFPCNPEATKVLDSHPEAVAHTIMISGNIKGRSAQGIALVVYGQDEDDRFSSGVHGFMAPTEIFQALGGYAIPAVKWLQASAQPNENMLADGTLTPKKAVARLGLFFSTWVKEYVIPMVMLSTQIQLQTIRSMESWNNAMNSCAGASNCIVVEATDGSGNWEAQRN